MIPLKNIPFTYHWIVRRAIGKDIKTVLDLGCGEGTFMRDISKGENWEIVGVELFESSIKKANKSGVYKKVIKGDVVSLPRQVTQNKYDVVFASQVLEHLKKEDGQKALKTWQTLAKKRLVISTPVGFIEFEPIERKRENNPLQKHLSGWKPEELSKLGFEAKGQGATFIYGKQSLARKIPPLLSFWSSIAFLFSPLVYLFPNKGLYMVAVKMSKETDYA